MILSEESGRSELPTAVEELLTLADASETEPGLPPDPPLLPEPGGWRPGPIHLLGPLAVPGHTPRLVRVSGVLARGISATGVSG